MADVFAGNPLYTDKDKTRVLPSLSKSSYRSDYRRDYGRLLHSAAFRRLQGKTQLFPSSESDFSRNRLTHSLEVAQIAKAIALKLNHEFLLGSQNIDLDIVEIAGLAHDLGHPPFGHNGELALDECMREGFGGFEGNGQTLRILSKLEKKETITKTTEGKHEPIKEGEDQRCGLNLTYRVLAAILKYDYKIPLRQKDRLDKYKECAPKGYYNSEEALVNDIKKSVLNLKALPKDLKFKTIECQIMDIADDIAYSTYDIEDAFKAGFLNPLALISQPNAFYADLSREVKKAIDKQYSPSDYTSDQLSFTSSHAIILIDRIFRDIFDVYEESGYPEKIEDVVPFQIASQIAYSSKQVASDGYYRTKLTSDLVGEFVDGIQFTPDTQYPPLSKVYLDIEIFKRVEVLKQFAHLFLIKSSMLKLTEFRGKDIVTSIFKALTNDEREGYMLLPQDFRDLYLGFEGNELEQRRVVCDFISGMTDKYCMEFYNRICGTSPESIHKPL